MNAITQQLITELAAVSALEAGALLFGLLAVYWLIVEKIWTWPAGLIYVVITLIMTWPVGLYGQFVLHLFFGAMNLYGWWYWQQEPSKDVNAIRFAGWRMTVALSIAAVLIGATVAWLRQQLAEPSALAWLDMQVTVLSFAAMWLAARKYVENWLLWFIIDVMAAVLFWLQGFVLYFILYLVYLPMAVSGGLAWYRSANGLGSTSPDNA